MPAYDYDCPTCGVFESVHRMADKLKKCPTCGAKVDRVYSLSVNVRSPADMFWENENGGKGRYISGLGHSKDAGSYARSIPDAVEKAKRLGKTVELH